LGFITGLKEIPKNIWLISAATLINRIGTMVLPFLALYLTQDKHYSVSSAGLILTVYGVGAFISAPFIGRLSDKVGELLLMRLSLILGGITLFIYSFLESYIAILALTFILAVIAEAFRPASMAFISNNITDEIRKPAFALYRLAINLGMSIGPVLGGVLTEIDFHLLFYVDAVTSISAGIFIWLIKWETLSDNSEKNEDEIAKEKKAVFRDKNLLLFLLGMLPVTIVFFQHMSTLPIYLVDNLGYSKSMFGLLVSVNTVLIILFELPLNNAMKKTTDWKSLLWGAVLSGVGFGLFALFTSIPGIIFIIMIWSFGEMILFPSGNSFISVLAPKGRRGEYMGYYQMMFSLSFILAPLIGTAIYENFGSIILWIGTFVLSLISAFIFYRLRKA
jgi:MFS family permease